MASSAAMQGWELSALFLVFLFITLFWDFLVGFLTFLNNILRGRKANWLARVKDELLALGVVSLVLLFMEPSLQHFCMPRGNSSYDNEDSPSSPPSPPAEYGTYYCADGYRQVFPRTVIHAAHYLLFYLAIVHILFSLLTSVITNARLAKWSVLERTARKEQNIPAVAFLRISSVIARARDPANNRPAMRARETWRDAIGFVDQDLYSLLRFMCEKRFRAHSVVLRNFNFLNMCEQCLEAELNEVYSHAWLLVFMMSLLLLYNKIVYQMIWVSFLCVCTMALMAGNMRWVMKKTAREARNLWRKVQGMGGLEVDGDEAAPPPPLGDGGGSPVAAPPVGWLSGGLEMVNGPLPPGGAAHPVHLQAAAAQRQLMAMAAAAAAAGGGGGAADPEAGDVQGMQRADQQQLARHGQHLNRPSLEPRPPKQLRFASFPRTGSGPPGPVGESREEEGEGERQGEPLPDPAAAAIATVPSAVPVRHRGRSGECAAAAIGPPASGALAQPPRCPGWQTHGFGGRPTGQSAQRRSLVDLLEACREVRAAASLAAGTGPANGSRGYGLSYSRHNGGRSSCRSSRSSGGCCPGVCEERRSDGGPWWEPCVYGTVGRGDAATTSGNARWIAPQRPPGWSIGRRGGGGGAAVMYGGGDPSGTGCRKRPVGRLCASQQGPGPLGEGTISNPLYGTNDGAGGIAGASGALGVGFSSQLSQHSAQLYGLGLGSGAAGAATGMGPTGLYVTQTSGGFMHQYSGVAASYTGMMGERTSAANAIASAAAAPYGASGNGFVATSAAAAAARVPPLQLASTAPQAQGPSAAAAADNGQWGSNPSSGSPEEGDESGSTRSGSRSSRSSAQGAAKGHGGGHGHGHGGEEDDDEDVHSEKSILEHELASGIEEKITRLFFFGRPFLLLWLFNIIFAQASLTMTMSMAFVIPYNKFDYIRDVAMPMYIWLPVVLTNLMLVFYGCWVFLPQYALLSVCGILEPHEVMDEIKRSKTADKVEEGISGIVLEKMTNYFIGRHDGETRLSTAFIVTLASQAGIILGRDYKAQRFINKLALKPMYREFVMVWHDIAWYGDLTSEYMIKTDVPDFKEAFDELDEDGSGALSFGELANMIRSLGTYATAGDVEAMLWEIDIDNSRSIGFDEFVKFLVYAFFDAKQLGYIDSPALIDAMQRLGMPINDMQASVLMSVATSDPDEEVKVTIRQFFGMFEKVVFAEVEALKEVQGLNEAAPAGGGTSQRGSFVSRAKDFLSSPSSAWLGRQRTSSMRQQDSGTGTRGGGLWVNGSGGSSGDSGAGANAGGGDGDEDGGGGGGSGAVMGLGYMTAAVAASNRVGGGGGGAGGGGPGAEFAGRGKQPSRLAMVTKP